MRQFAGVSKFAYMQMNTRMGTPVHVYRAYSLYHILIMQSSKGCSSWGRLFPNFSDFRLVGGVGLNNTLRSISVYQTVFQRERGRKKRETMDE